MDFRDARRRFPLWDKGELLGQPWDMSPEAGRLIPEIPEFLGRSRLCPLLWLRPLLEVAEAACTALC